MKYRNNKKFRDKANNMHRTDADSLRFDQVYYQNAPFTGESPSVSHKFTGTPYIDLGATSALYSEMVSTRNFDKGGNNFVTGAPAMIDYGTISNDDTGADWELNDDGVLVPNTVAEQIELKAGLIEAKIRNSMYTELDILNYVPVIDTKIQGNTVSAGQLYVRYMMASKYNTFVLARFWTDLQAVIRSLVLMSRNNKLLVDRVNMVMNEMRRSRIQAALQSLTSASTMIMTDSWMWHNVLNTTGCTKLDESLASPVVYMGTAVNLNMYENKSTWLQLKRTASDPSAETKYNLTLDLYTLPSIPAMVEAMLTLDDTEWINKVNAFGQEVLKGAQKLTLAIASLQHIYQVLNTALAQIGQDIISDRFGFQQLSLDIFGKPAFNATNILNYNILKFSTIEYETTGSLTRTVKALVPCNIANIPIDAFKTNFVLATKDYGNDYKALVDVSDLYIHNIYGFVYYDNGTFKKCHNINAWWGVATAKTKLLDFYGLKIQVPEISLEGFANHMYFSLRKFMDKYEPIYRIGKTIDKLDWYIADGVFGTVEVSYMPIYDKVLMRAVSNFGLID